MIAAAHYADAVNRAGKLRMLSQRLVKACALRVLERGGAAPRRRRSTTRRGRSTPTSPRSEEPVEADLRRPARRRRGARGRAAGAAPRRRSPPADLAALDAAAERLLLQAEKLTRGLETAGLVTTLHVINVSGRQRMLSQRHAKEALLGLVLEARRRRAPRAPSWRAPPTTFEQALAHLRAIPLSTGEIRALLDDAERVWTDVVGAARQVGQASGARALDAASDAAARASSSSSPTATSAACRC